MCTKMTLNRELPEQRAESRDDLKDKAMQNSVNNPTKKRIGSKLSLVKNKIHISWMGVGGPQGSLVSN